MRSLLLVMTLGLFALVPPASAQDLKFKLPGAGGRAKNFSEIATTSIEIEPKQAKRGETVTLRFTIAPKPNCYTYPMNPPDHQLGKNTLGLPKSGPLVFVGSIIDPPGAKAKPSALDPTKNDRIYETPVTWTFQAVVSPEAKPGKQTLTFRGTALQACTTTTCLNSTTAPVLEFEILDAPPVVVEAKYAAEVMAAKRTMPAEVAPPNPPSIDAAAPKSVAKAAPVSPADYEDRLKSLEAVIGKTPTTLQGGLLGLLTAAIFWGFVSLLTPCVFPMIPITISLFLKQADNSSAKLLRLAAVYSLTIIVVLGLSALFLLALFRRLSVDPYMNIALAVLFIAFALSLFGLFDIQLPGFLLRAADKRRAAGGLLGTVFGAITFSIVGFTCVAPFLGGFAGLAASGNYSQLELAAAALAFATAFAAPFFLLALFPSLVKQLPRSGNWLITVKAVMGFLELAAAIKFLRTAEIRLLDRPEYLTYDVALAAWVVIAVAAGLYLLNLYRLPHDHDEAGHVGVVRLMFALGFLGFGLHLAPGLWKANDAANQRPNGVVYAWVNAFLLPEAAESAGELPWSNDLKGAIDRIVKDKAAGGVGPSAIFVDFTGKTCSNCKLNEQQVFPKPEVAALLKQFALVQLFTDEVPGNFYASAPSLADRNAEGAANFAFQDRLFGTSQLPLYVVLVPSADGSVAVRGVYDEGKINDVPGFVEFLKAGLK